MAENVSRRGFIKAVGAGAGALAISGALTSPGSVFAAPAGAILAQPGRPGQDPQIDAVVTEYVSLNVPPLPTVVPRVARELPSIFDAARSVASKQGKPTVEQVAKVAHTVIKGPGGQLLLRMYYPQGSGPFPVIVYFHGGGWVIGTINVYDGSARAITNATGALVVSVAYRNGPEAPFPGAHMDAITAYKWVLANIAQFQGDPNRVAVAGESAGGNLATATAMMAKEQGVKLPIHQSLVYPVTNTWYGQPDMNFPSYAEFTDAVPLSTPGLAWFYKFYLRNAGDANNVHLSPLKATTAQLSGLPPATVITAAIDPLRDEGVAYKDKLAAAGVTVTGMTYPGTTHEFLGLAGVADISKKALMDMAMDLKRAFGTA